MSNKIQFPGDESLNLELDHYEWITSRKVSLIETVTEQNKYFNDTIEPLPESNAIYIPHDPTELLVYVLMVFIFVVGLVVCILLCWYFKVGRNEEPRTTPRDENCGDKFCPCCGICLAVLTASLGAFEG